MQKIKKGDSALYLGGSASGSGLGSIDMGFFISLAINKAGNPVISWTELDLSTDRNIYVKQWNGSSWEELGGSASGSGLGRGDYGSLAINLSGNPIVAWTETISTQL